MKNDSYEESIAHTKMNDQKYARNMLFSRKEPFSQQNKFSLES